MINTKAYQNSKKIILIIFSKIILTAHLMAGCSVSYGQEINRVQSRQVKQSGSSKTEPTNNIQTIIEPSLVQIYSGGSNVGTGVAFFNGGDGNKINTTSIFASASNIKDREEVSVIYAGARIKANITYLDNDLDLAIIRVIDTVIPAINFDDNFNIEFDRSNFWAYQLNSNSKMVKFQLAYAGSRKINGTNFQEFSGAFPRGEGGLILFDDRGVFAGVVSGTFYPSSQRVLVIDRPLLKRYSRASEIAEVIKILAIDPAYHKNLGDGFGKWIAKGSSNDSEKYFLMYDKAMELIKEQTLDSYEKTVKALYSIAELYISENRNSTTSRSPEVVNLVCDLYGRSGSERRTMTFSINFEKSTVNNFPANISQNSITYNYGSSEKYNVQIDRVAGTAIIGTSQFPMLISGKCQKVEGKAF